VRGRGEPPCERVLALLDDKIDAVNQQVQALSAFGQELVALREEAEEVMQANGGICRIIEHYTPAPSNQAIRAKARALRPLGGR